MKIGGHSIGIGKGGGGTILGSLLMPGIGTAIGWSMDQQAKAQQEMDDAIAAQGAATQAEIARRRGNVNEIKAMYGKTDASQTAAQKATANVMGAKLARDVRTTGSNALNAATAANAANTSSSLTAANAAAAATGTAGSSTHQANKAGVMGQWMLGQQNAATGAAQVRGSAVEKLAQGQQAAEASALGGALNIDPALQSRQQAGAFRAAGASVPLQVMGRAVEMGTGTSIQALQANEMSGGNYLGVPSLSGGRSAPSGTFTQKG